MRFRSADGRYRPQVFVNKNVVHMTGGEGGGWLHKGEKGRRSSSKQKDRNVGPGDGLDEGGRGVENNSNN
jgi:hypothetical protein